MSFGASPSDIISVVTFCKTLYRKCRSTGGEYDEISHEVRGLHTVLRHLKYEVEAPDSPLYRDRTIWSRQLAPTIADCDLTLKQLDALILRHGSHSGTSSPEKARFGSDEMDQLGAIRVKLIRQKTSLTVILDNVQLPASKNTAASLDNTGGQLDIILDKVDSIAVRMGQRHDEDDREAWKQFRRELIAEGFSSEVLTQNEEVLRAYIREMDQQGLLDTPLSETIVATQPAGSQTTRPLQLITEVPPEDSPPSFESHHIPKDDSGAKEMLAREDNMKFPPSMKLERRKPESRRDDVPQAQLASPTVSENRQLLPSVSKLSPLETKRTLYINTDGSSDEDEDSDSSIEPPQSPSNWEVIKTAELIALSQALTIRPSGASGSYNAGSFIDDQVPRSIAHRPKRIEYGSSPSQPGAIPIPSPNTQFNGRLGTSPRPDPVYLAPDEKGNEIRPDAKWTKINRRLVSPEVLSQDGRRYEARPDFVAVLGVLSHAEIESLATRSAALRSARPPHAYQPQPPLHPPPPAAPRQAVYPPHPPQPPYPPHPSSFPRAIPTPRHSTSDSDHDQSHTSSESDYPRQPRHKVAKPLRSILKNSNAQNYTHAQQAHSPVQPPLSPGWNSEGGRWPRDQGGAYDWDRDRERENDRERERARERERLREQDREARKKDRRDRDREREKEKGKEKEKEKEKEKPKKGFKLGHRDLTAAGIGGAAVSLLTVLSEAAQGL